MLYAEQGEEAFNTVMGTEGNSCASCHDGPASLANVRATYPQWDEAHGGVQTVEMQVIECQTERMGAEPYGYDSQQMRNMVALIASVGRGQTVKRGHRRPRRRELGGGARRSTTRNTASSS